MAAFNFIFIYFKKMQNNIEMKGLYRIKVPFNLPHLVNYIKTDNTNIPLSFNYNIENKVIEILPITQINIPITYKKEVEIYFTVINNENAFIHSNNIDLLKEFLMYLDLEDVRNTERELYNMKNIK
jgi:hypothetical protein